MSSRAASARRGRRGPPSGRAGRARRDRTSTSASSTGRPSAPCCPRPGGGRSTSAAARAESGGYLAAAGHRLAGVERSPTLVELAREAGGYEELVCGSATSLPWPPAIFDLAVAFMSLQDIDDPVAAIDELGRVVVPGGSLCIAIVHPLNRPAELLDAYFDEHRVSLPVERNGIEMTFEAIVRPLETYTTTLAGAGFVIEQLREPRPPAGSPLATARSRPFFLHLRCRREDE